jgi:hypothetical protein
MTSRAIAAAAVLCAGVVGLSPTVATSAPGERAASAATRLSARADLMVASGNVRLVNDRYRGSFVVRNRGRGLARASVASLALRSRGARGAWKRFRVPALRRSATRVVRVSLGVPASLPPGAYGIQACANSGGRIRERSRRNNCRTVGRLVVAPAPQPPAPQPPAPQPPAPQPPAPKPPAPPVSSIPANPLPFQDDNAFTIGIAPSNYWIYVPTAYDETHRTPTTLFVWLHGCGGKSEFDIWMASLGPAQSYITIAPGGREGGCWNAGSDSAGVLAAIANVKTHFNINPRRVVLGGYSSGGDLAYRTAFYNASMFAGVLAEDTTPFRDTGSTGAASLAAAAWKFHVVHVAHVDDNVYPIDTVRAETDAMSAAGFPMQRIERAGGHWIPDTPTTGTKHDLRTLLLPHLNDGWVSPG